MPQCYRLLLVFLASVICGAVTVPEYVSDVRPILSERCYVCHGPAQQMAGLRLDERRHRALCTKGGAGSEFVRRISSDEPSVRMPPWPAALSLSPSEIKTLRVWAENGAPGDEPAFPDPAVTVLIAAIDRGDSVKVRSMLRNRGLLRTRGLDGASPLMHAALNSDPNTVRLLLNSGADANEPNYEGSTPLIWAIDDPAKVKLLLAAGSNVNAKTKHGVTALLAASAA